MRSRIRESMAQRTGSQGAQWLALPPGGRTPSAPPFLANMTGPQALGKARIGAAYSAAMRAISLA